MAVDVIQADYDQLEKIASCFGQQADNNTALLARLNQTVEQLRSGSWEGQAAGAFFAEMNGEIFPAMQRLTGALEQAQAVTLKAKVVIRQAEEEAAGLFGGEGTPSLIGGSVGMGGGGAGGGSGGSWGATGGGAKVDFFRKTC